MAVVILTILYVGWRFWPIYELAQSILPSTAAEDYAKQDDNRVPLPTPLELTPRSYDPLPGDAEEWDFPGKVGAASSPALRRLRTRPDTPPHSQTFS